MISSLGKGWRYGWPKFAGDLSGGAIAALIALPYGLAMATLMGLPPVLGVFTSILTSPVTAALGRNPVLVGGTGSATVPFLAQAVREQGIGGAAKVSIVAAVIMMVFCVLRLGRHITKVPHAVITGFSCGIGAMMVLSQVDIIFGLNAPVTHAAGTAFEELGWLVGRMAEIRIAPLAIGLTVIAGATLCAHYSRRIPAPLVGIVMAMILAKSFGFTENEIGELTANLPDFVGFSWRPQDVYTVLPSGFALAFVVSVNILITSKVVEHFQGRHRRMKVADADAELGAYGIANLFAGMFGAPLSVGIPARSLAVVRCGGTTRLSNLWHAVFLIAILRYGTGLMTHIPVAAMAGVTAWMGLCLLDWGAWRRIPKMNRLDAGAFLATAFSVVAVNAVLAVAVGCSLYGLHAFQKRLFRTEQRLPDPQTP